MNCGHQCLLICHGWISLKMGIPTFNQTVYDFWLFSVMKVVYEPQYVVCGLWQKHHLGMEFVINYEPLVVSSRPIRMPRAVTSQICYKQHRHFAKYHSTRSFDWTTIQKIEWKSWSYPHILPNDAYLNRFGQSLQLLKCHYLRQNPEFRTSPENFHHWLLLYPHTYRLNSGECASPCLAQRSF